MQSLPALRSGGDLEHVVAHMDVDLVQPPRRRHAIVLHRESEAALHILRRQEWLVAQVTEPVPASMEPIGDGARTQSHPPALHDHREGHLVVSIGLVDHLLEQRHEGVYLIFRELFRRADGITGSLLCKESIDVRYVAAQSLRDASRGHFAVDVHLARETLLVRRHAGGYMFGLEVLLPTFVTAGWRSNHRWFDD